MVLLIVHIVDLTAFLGCIYCSHGRIHTVFTITSYKENNLFFMLTNQQMSQEAYLQLYFTIPDNLPRRQNTSAHRAGDSLWEGWVTNLFVESLL